MANLSDLIEQYLRELVEAADRGILEIKRQKLAEVFGCAPSQINYVLQTRFTPEHGYMVESRRGGGGYIRLVRVDLDMSRAMLQVLDELVGDEIDQHSAYALISRLRYEGTVTARESALMRAAVDRDALRLELPLRDYVRARVMKGMLMAIVRHKGGE